ncbi:SDR family NAD(P)-dependent oxidoreductase [Rhodoferax sp. PAMC 29310]|uniref:SDR family NAD(P)-dependent oxidoreductase n=1 Tax=Rhodoferax sp. PAMC 29310 TaxID=2822760 RepID=UPI0021031F8B|nr:SDR family NAD(P)-dependent oxidoreductase [Rhodoferax sp. PAMC 29310]
MQDAIDALLKAEGRLDALVNNAGYGSYGTIEDVPLDEARRQFEVNVFGLARLSQLVLPTMRQAKSGTIVNISSMGGRIWMPVGGWYHATKYAVEVLSDAMRVEVKPFGVNVVVVQPGAIESEWSGISARNLLANSKGSVYSALIQPMAALLGNYANAASPDVVANAVSRAVNCANPRRRYATPMDAKALIFLHWLLPTFAWEALVRTAVQSAAQSAAKKAGQTT